MPTSIIHSLPGRLRIHLADEPLDDKCNYLAVLGQERGFRSARIDRWTGNVLVYYDTAVTDEATILHALRPAELPTSPPPRTRLGARTAVRGAERPQPDPIRVVLPVLHMVYSCTPVGAAMHLAELGWAVGRSAGRVRVAMPVVHLILSCHPIGTVVHAGELIWALIPFLAPGRGRRVVSKEVIT